MISWEELLYDIAEGFGGQMPHPETAADIQAAYHRAPNTVLRAIDRVNTEYADGTAKSPWGLLRHRVKDIQADTQKAERRVDRDKAIERAEQRIRNELLHYERWPEAEDELFGDRGTLREHRDPKLRERMETLWHELRPAGELVEHEQEERLARYQETRAALERIPKQATPGNLTVDELKALAARKSQSVTEALT